MKFAKAMKRLAVLALVVALLIGMPVAAQAGKNYYCTGDRVNLRTGPSSGYASLAKLKKGAVVTYLSQDNGWYRVKYYKKSTDTVIIGYVYRKYLSTVSPSSKTGNKVSKSSISVSNVYKTTVNLRVRSEPSIETGYIRTKLKAGTKVSIVKQKRSWVFVTYKGGSGWVSAKYLKKVKK